MQSMTTSVVFFKMGTVLWSVEEAKELYGETTQSTIRGFLFLFQGTMSSRLQEVFKELGIYLVIHVIVAVPSVTLAKRIAILLLTGKYDDCF